MSFVLFVLGAIASAAGILMIGFGIPINEFSLGNTLIIAGTTLLAGGLVIIGLAVTNRQLKRVADLLARPGSRPAEMTETAPAQMRPEPMRGPAGPAKTRPDIQRETGYSDRQFQPGPEEPDFGQPRMRSGSPPIFEPIDDVTLSPRTPPRTPSFETAQQGAEPAADHRGWRPPGLRQPASAPASPPDPRREMPASERPAAPQQPRGNPDAVFESIWPNARKAEQRPSAPVAAPPQTPGARSQDDMFHREPPVSASADQLPVSVLKSGVVDGMAYTLYTDGSIEAELAQGVVRFGSIEELRNHLEKSA